MSDISIEFVSEVLVLIGEVLVMVLLSTVGILAERAGLSHLGSGIDPLTVWFFYVGSVALYAGVYMLGYQTILQKALDFTTNA
jgi:hypothetical protein